MKCPFCGRFMAYMNTPSRPLRARGLKHNDMANDAGYRYGTSENAQLASMIEADEYRKQQEHEYERDQEGDYHQ